MSFKVDVILVYKVQAIKYRVVGWHLAYPAYVFKYYKTLLENGAEVEVCWVSFALPNIRNITLSWL